MANKTTPGAGQEHLLVGTTRPSGDDGIDMSQFTGGSKADRWQVTGQFIHESTQAILDLDTPSLALDSTVRAKEAYLGNEGNNIRIRAVADSGLGVGVTIEEADRDVTIHFEDGVSTVLDVETAIAADSDVIEVSVPGTAATVLVAGDAFAFTNLAGGTGGRAVLDLDTPSVDLDSTVRAKEAYFGVEGNGIRVRAVADSGAGEGVTIEEVEGQLDVTIHFEDGVSTVLDVETAIAADSDVIEVSVPGTAATVLVAGDAFAFTNLAGGADIGTTFDLFVWGRDMTTKRWGLHNDSFGRCRAGLLFENALVGHQHAFLRDLGNYDRVAFSREASTGEVNVRLTEILTMGRGN